LGARFFRQEDCGLVALSHFRDAYLLYHQPSDVNAGLRGIVSGLSANDVLLSSVAAGLEPLAVMHFNKDAYSIYCREYREYWEWAGERNEERYRNTISHGQNYDAKNMMHTFRLLSMAEEIALERRVIVHRDDRDFLLRIRAGEFAFEELMARVEEKMGRIEELFDKCGLPETPDVELAESLLVRIREEFYV
jgi:hypothetical protein